MRLEIRQSLLRQERYKFTEYELTFDLDTVNVVDTGIFLANAIKE